MKSDDDLEIFEGNTPSSFSNKLATPLHFNEPVSIALRGIQYNPSFENYNSKHDSIILFDFMYLWKPYTKQNPSSTDKFGIYYNISLKSGFYHDPNKFIARLNSQIKSARIKRLKGKNIFRYDESTKKFSINIDGTNLALILEGNAISIMGLTKLHRLENEYVVIGKSKKYDYFLDGKTKKYFLPSDDRRWTSSNRHGGSAPFPAELDSNAIFNIYLEELSSGIYGSSYSKLLKTMNSKIEGLSGDHVYQEFSYPIFLPLAGQSLHVLSVQIKNQYSTLVKFLKGGPIVLFLQIKPTRLV